MVWKGFQRAARGVKSFFMKAEHEAVLLEKGAEHVLEKVEHGVGHEAVLLEKSAARVLKIAEYKAWLLEEGVVHFGSASPETKHTLARDLATVIVESALAVTETVAPEVAVAVAVGEIGTELLDGHILKKKLTEGVVIDAIEDGVLGAVFKATAAAHATVNLVRDLEESGKEWEQNHPKHPAPP